MGQTHFLATELRDSSGRPWGTESRARLATSPSGDCILFVHGFGGDAVDTWIDFPGMLPRRSQAAGCDLLSFGYESRSESADSSAGRFLKLLDALSAKAVQDVINPSLPFGAPRRVKSFRYQNVLICAHSLGAIVVRKALIRWAKRGFVGFGSLRLLFFAPAHKGASIIPLVSLALAGVRLPFTGGLISGKTVEAALKYKMPSLNDLEVGSETLAQLERDTEAALANGKNEHLRAFVVHGHKDRIVRQGPFVNDYETVFEDKGHLGVCKPEAPYPTPIYYALRVLSGRGLK